MGILSKLFGRAGKATPAGVAEAPPCSHVVLVPGWGSAEDMGKDDRATRFTCDACGTVFTPAEAEALRKTEAERLRETLGAE